MIGSTQLSLPSDDPHRLLIEVLLDLGLGLGLGRCCLVEDN